MSNLSGNDELASAKNWTVSLENGSLKPNPLYISNLDIYSVLIAKKTDSSNDEDVYYATPIVLE
jgi:hypothetical protein